MGRRVIVTGAAGFIGSAVVRHAVLELGWTVLSLDKLTYAGNRASLRDAEGPGHEFLWADICDGAAVAQAFERFRPDAVMHLAAESHVDRSIDGPAAFIQTNVVGTATMLECARRYYSALNAEERAAFRFLHVSTDEVYGSLGLDGLFSETTPYDPRSPYAASKAASDHLALAWFHTYGLPIVVTHSSNNYGPYHFPEKLIPLVILNALHGHALPVYGRGEHVRDWLYVDDHARALALALQRGAPGRTYSVGGRSERRNIDVVHGICDLLDELRPRPGGSHRGLITYVADRPGHDLRYAIDASRIERELGWTAREDFATGLRKTVEWYLDNAWWWRPIREQKYAGERLGAAIG